MYDGEPVRVRIDDRDVRGGEKKWQQVKRGVPLRVEIGPRDIAERQGDGRPPRRGRQAGSRCREPSSSPTSPTTLDDDAAGAVRPRARRPAARQPCRSTTLKEFEAFFTPKNEEQPEIHGGLAYSHFVESPEMDEKLKALKVTIRCVPLDAQDEPGKCIFTGQPSNQRGVFAKAY